jgi:HK97 family phage portal protein
MNIFKKKIDKKKQDFKIETVRRSIQTFLENEIYIGDDIRSQFLNGYLANNAVYRIVNLRVNDASSVRPLLKKNSGKDAPIDHKLYKLLRHPNNIDTYKSFMTKVYFPLVLNGKVYIRKVRSSFSIEFLYAYSSNDVRVIKTNPYDIDNPIDHYEVGTNNVIVMPKDMIFIHTYDPTDPTEGVSFLTPAKRAIEMSNLIDTRNKSILIKESSPSMKYKIPADSNLTDEEVDQILEQILSYSGPNNAGKTWLLDNGNDIEEMGTNLSDFDFLSGKKNTLREICNAGATPPEKAGDGENKTYANATEANMAFAQESVLSDVKLVFDALSSSLLSEDCFSDIGEMTFNEDDIKDLKGNETAKYTALSAVQFLTPNEKREQMGYAPIEELESVPGNTILVNGGTTTLENAIKGVQSQTTTSAPKEEGSGEKTTKEPDPSQAE